MITQILSFSSYTHFFTAGPNSIAVAALIGLLYYMHYTASTPLSSAITLHYSAGPLYPNSSQRGLSTCMLSVCGMNMNLSRM
jgi:hypothetical protein